ncbi:unnamed protein product [Angiostrongylus costaricensis]|uniref:RNA-binding protein 19 n=1 Tax=Angiostrongylus costaricensis TaxID=334426 RepID=A0A0R3PZB0_ANGCS|nr:unnamed protein product [Angiostrongylus costaricensis]
MTTRLIVKSLPSNCTEEKLRAFFKKYGTLSDCTLKYTTEGKFRKFAFVGFDNAENAKKALKETHLSYMDSSRLQVEECKPFGDANKPRAWSQYSKDSSAYKRKHDDGSTLLETAAGERTFGGTAEKKRKLDPEYRDFLWTQGINCNEPQKRSGTENAVDSDELLKELLKGITGDTKLSLIFSGLPASIKQKNLKEWLTPLTISKAKVEDEFPDTTAHNKDNEDIPVSRETEEGRMMHIIPGSERREKPYEMKPREYEKTSYKKEKIAKLKINAGKVHSWNSLFLGPNAVADTLAERLGIGKSDLINSEIGESSTLFVEVVFSSAGVRLALAETKLVRETREFFIASGVCLDAFSRPAANRSNMVIIAKNLPANVKVEELQRMFGKFGEVDKVLMPPEGGISAIIAMSNSNDAKKAFQALAYSRFHTQPLYLEWAPGDVFGKPVEKRPEATCEVDVQISEAERSVKKKNKREMTYEERKHERMRRKKGKADVQDENAMEPEVTSLNSAQPSSIEGISVEGEKSSDPQPISEGFNSNDSEAVEPGSTVFVKNLSFETTDENLAKLFRVKYRIKFAQISKKLNPADPGKSLSMGFGFIQFYTQDEAQRAIKEMQGELLDGHCLELKISHRELNDKDALKRKLVAALEQGDCTKLLIRNIPFQASIKEIESLFSSFGEVKSIRIPKKIGNRNQHRGFGFVDFISIGEAKRAFEALVHSTHIYGRRLVLEWAKQDDTVQEIREKTAEKFSGNRAALRKQKKRIEAIEKDLAVIDDD